LAINDQGFRAEFRKLPRCLGPELLDIQFQAPRRHRELGAQLVFVGSDLLDR